MPLTPTCKTCPTNTPTTLYVEIFSNKHITEANAKDPMLPKLGFHLGAICTKCGSFITHIKQTPAIIGQKFIHIPVDK